MREYEFSVDEKLVYPSHGIGVVKEIFQRDFKGVSTDYYKIYIEVSDMYVMVPVAKTEELGIRKVVSKEEAEEAVKLLGSENEPITSDWKLRYQMNLDLLKKGTVKDIALIVRCLYNRSRVKELPVLERKLYDSAKKLLIDEVSLATEQSIEKVEEDIRVVLEPAGDEQKPKHPADDDFDDDDDLVDMDDVGTKDEASDEEDDEEDEEDEDDTIVEENDGEDDDFSDDEDDEDEDDDLMD